MGNIEVHQEPSPREQLEELLREKEGRLSPREQAVLRMRCGLFDDRPYTQAEVAMLFGVSTERIRMMESKVIRILRRYSPARRKKIREFYKEEETT